MGMMETALAAPASAALAQGRAKECLTFKLGNEEYGIDILKVQEIRSYEAPTKIANAPAYIKGVVNLRGVIVPIVDLRMKFGIDDARYDSFTVVVVLNLKNRVVGMVVDAVSDVVELTNEQIRPAPEFSGAFDAGCLTGIGLLKQGDVERMLILLDIETLMAGSDIGLASASYQ